MSYDWREHWKSEEHPFHLMNVNPLLERYWQDLQLPVHSNVLVPLCGKSLDLLWLAQQGYSVIGIEISEIASKEFFVENNLSFECQKYGDFVRYTSENITIYCGDFFKLHPKILPDIAAVYDRAALIALPPLLRQSYVEKLIALMNKNTKMLLIVMDTADPTQEHPYPLNTGDIHHLFLNHFAIKEFARVKISNLCSFLISRGYRTAYEVVYQLRKKECQFKEDFQQ